MLIAYLSYIMSVRLHSVSLYAVCEVSMCIWIRSLNYIANKIEKRHTTISLTGRRRGPQFKTTGSFSRTVHTVNGLYLYIIQSSKSVGSKVLEHFWGNWGTLRGKIMRWKNEGENEEKRNKMRRIKKKYW